MRTTKNWFGLVLALLPILFIGGLLLYLNNVRTMFGGLLDGAMGPTMLGLAGIGLLFVLLFLLRLRKAATPPAPPRSGEDRVAAALEETKSDFDADAAIARYLAKRAAGGPGPASPDGGAPVRPGSFGRKGV